MPDVPDILTGSAVGDSSLDRGIDWAHVDQLSVDEVDDYLAALRVIVSEVLYCTSNMTGDPITVDDVINYTRRTWSEAPANDVEHALGDLERLQLARCDDNNCWMATTIAHRRRTGFNPKRTHCERRCTRIAGHRGEHLPRGTRR